MKGLPFVLAFTAMTFVAWGAYGPLLHHGTQSMDNDSLRAFVGVGIAYFFIAVLVPIYILRSQGEAGKWTISGTFYSLVAGSVGALGALGVILALAYGGAPIYVMPLVFGFAPIVNTLVTAWMSKTFDQISPIFIGGIVIAALGVAGVLAFKPVPPPNAAHPPKHSETPSLKNQDQSHSLKNRPGSAKLVSTILIQEPEQDPLPPVVVQPPAPGESPAVPQTEPSQPKPPEEPVAQSEPPAPPVVEQEELPPVVVQPAPPPEEEKPVPTPEKPAVAQDTEAELPPIVEQPAPLQQSEVRATAPVASPQEAPKVDTPKPEETKPATASEPIKPEATKVDPSKPEPADPELAKPEPAESELVKPAQEAPTEAPKPLDTEMAERPMGQLQRIPQSASAAEVDKPSKATKEVPPPHVPMIILSIVVAALCWGSYGPMLHQGQARMGGSRLRPFTCVGLAYFFIAVAAPLAIIYARTADTGSWSFGGLSWSIIAGAAGAIGALGVILAFNAGGKPYYVMPLVFGFAPVINTCISLTEKGTWGLVTPMFWISLAVVIAGAITVLLNAPKPTHAKPAT